MSAQAVESAVWTVWQEPLILLKSPVFIEANIIRPIFNRLFSEELLRCTNWLCENVLDKNAGDGLQEIVNEAIRINAPLLTRFQNYENEVDAAYLLTHGEKRLQKYEITSVNPSAKLWIGECCGEDFVPIISEENCMALFAIHRKLTCFIFGKEHERRSESEFAGAQFVDIFLMLMYAYNSLLDG